MFSGIYRGRNLQDLAPSCEALQRFFDGINGFFVQRLHKQIQAAVQGYVAVLEKG